MKKGKKSMKVKSEVIGEPTHILKLLNKIDTELCNNFFEMKARTQIREMVGNLPLILDDMDSKDEDFQNLPENKIKSLWKELEDKSELLKRNKEQFHLQVQVGLLHKGYPQGNPMYHTWIERTKMELEEDQMKIDSKLKIINPMFEFQNNKRWKEIQIKMTTRKIKATKENLKLVEQQVEEVKNDITAQNEKIKNRRVQILEELEKLGEDVKELKKKAPDYIN